MSLYRRLKLIALILLFVSSIANIYFIHKASVIRHAAIERLLREIGP